MCISRSQCSTAVTVTWYELHGDRLRGSVICHRSDKPIVAEATTHHADESSDGTSRYLRVSITAEATTCDPPPLLSP